MGDGFLLIPNAVYDLHGKIDHPFPSFDTEENCQAAIDSIGADKMLKIIKEFHQVGDKND